MKSADMLARVEGMFDAIPDERRRTGILIFFSLLVHVVFFGALRVSYPPEEHNWSPPVTATVIGLADSSPEAQSSDEFWNTVLDPSLIILPQSRVVDPTPMSWQINPRPLEETAAGTTLAQVGDSQTLPAELAPLAFRLRQALVPEKRAFDFNAVRPEPVKPQTQVRWSESLLPRLVAAGAELPAVPAGLLNEAGPTVLRLAVLSSGQVGTVLIAASSGKNETDTLAIKSVRQARFEPREGQTVQWGNVSIYWALSAETPTPSPTP